MMPSFPVHPNHITGVCTKIMQKIMMKHSADADLEYLIAAAKDFLRGVDDFCRAVADNMNNSEQAYTAQGPAMSHYPAGEFARVIWAAYRLKGTELTLNEKVDAVGTLRGAIYAAAHAIVWNFAVDGRKYKAGTREGGLNSHGLTAEERQERNELMQAEINRLCLQRHMSYKAACRRVAEKIQLIYADQNKIHPDTVKKNTKNPY